MSQLQWIFLIKICNLPPTDACENQFRRLKKLQWDRFCRNVKRMQQTIWMVDYFISSNITYQTVCYIFWLHEFVSGKVHILIRKLSTSGIYCQDIMSFFFFMDQGRVQDTPLLPVLVPCSTHQTLPASKACEIIMALLISFVRTPAAKPYIVLLAHSITSSMSLNLIIDCAGPKIYKIKKKKNLWSLHVQDFAVSLI